MVVGTTILAVAIVLIVVAFLHHIARLERAWTVERRELCNRIQAPQHVPLTNRVEFTIPETESDELDQVGTINFDE